MVALPAALGAGGLAPFAGPTAGYLFSWPFAAALIGWLTERLWDRYNVAWGMAVNVLGGTHMTVSAVDNPSGGASLYVFAQDEGDDVSVYTRDLTGGQWSSGKLPIPDD